MSRTNNTNLPDGSERLDKTGRTADPIEIELDTQQLRALDDPAASDPRERTLDDGKSREKSRDLSDTATNLELSQSLDDLRNLTWPQFKPRK